MLEAINLLAPPSVVGFINDAKAESVLLALADRCADDGSGAYWAQLVVKPSGPLGFRE